ncbi:MAG TPA: hypothetical protein DCY89_03630 [Gammaproteobacteria bacterium]|nr:hypothetical protein [Gammaproteobacteria bacterium]
MKNPNEGHEGPDFQALQVVDFLRTHPGFLLEHPDLLAQLELAVAPSGAASLTGRQVAALREQNHELRTRLRELIAVARANDMLTAAMHALALSVLRLADPDALLATCRRGFAGPSGLEPPVALLAFGAGPGPGADWWFAAGDPRAVELAGPLQAERPHCGRFKQAQLSALFGAAAEGVGSAVVAPMAGTGFRGVLAVGHADSRHYHPEMGVDLIAHVAACVALRIDAWLGPRSA